MEGWIKLYRKLTENPLWLCEPFTRGQAWVDLILMANHKPDFFYKRGVKINVERGQVGISEVGLSDRWKWSRTRVRKFLNDLEKEHQIEQHKTNVTQVITIINYEEYQQKEQQTIQQEDSRRTAEEQQKDTNKNDKNEKNEKKKERESKNLFDSVPESPDPSKIDFQKLGEYFNTNLSPPFAKIILPISKARKAFVQARANEYTKDKVFEMLKLAKNSSFLAGENDRCWVADFDWLFKPTNFLKILEGNYTETEGKKVKDKHLSDIERAEKSEADRVLKMNEQQNKYKEWAKEACTREEALKKTKST
jgi:hypothetical protein